MKNAQTKNVLLICSALIASAAMLTVIQAPVGFSFLAWVSLVPFILVCSPDIKTRFLIPAAYLVSLFYWLGNLYWIAPVTILGWITFCFYTAALWPILTLCLRWCRRKKIPLFLAAAVLFVGAERLQGLFLGGFFWRFLAHSQYKYTTIIQIADIFGAAGVSFLIAMVNGLLAELIIAAHRNRRLKAADLVKLGAVSAALLATILYGRWRINQSPEFIEDGPLVAALQSNVPQSVKREGLRGEGEPAKKTSQQIFDELLQKSKAGAKAGARLIVWPETMVQATLNQEILDLKVVDPTHPWEVFDNALRDHARDTAFLLIGAYSGKADESGTKFAERYNTAFLYRPDGEQDPKRYSKIHLVLFGEVLPFRKSCPLLFNLIMKFNPYGYDHSLDAGTQYTVFEMVDGDGRQPRTYNFGVIICYEAAVPSIARRLVLNEHGKKQINWLINISNDGWFVRFKDEQIRPSTELPQHAAICAFRAVENRTAVLRSVNTGISCLIDPLGRVLDGYIDASQSFPHQAMQRKGIAGWFLDKMPIDRRITFFSKYGQWLDLCCAMCLLSLLIVLSLAKLTKNKRHFPRRPRQKLTE